MSLSRIVSSVLLSGLAIACQGTKLDIDSEQGIVINQKPTVSFTSPNNNQIFALGEQVNISVSASDADGQVTQVEFIANNQSLLLDLEAPFELSKSDFILGEHQIEVIATDDKGASSNAFVVIKINDLTNAAPSISFNSPANNSQFTFAEPIRFSVDAIDLDGSISQVEFFVNNQSVSIDTASPYEYVNNQLSLGDHEITAVALDDKGATQEAKLSISIDGGTSNDLASPDALYFLSPEPYAELTLFWSDNTEDETGFVIERKFENSDWQSVATTTANATEHQLTNFDRSDTSYFRVKAIRNTQESPASEMLKVVGTSDTLEVYPEVAGIRAPQMVTVNGITFPEIQYQTPADPTQGHATRISTYFSAEVRTSASNNAMTPLNSPVYETRPQLRNFLAQDDPKHSGGHRPYGYGLYGPNSSKSGSSMHSKHWTNIDASEEVIVTIDLLSSGSLPSTIDINDLEIHPAPVSVTKLNDSSFEVTLPGATDYTRHYRIAVNRKAWSGHASTSNRGNIIIEAPLYVFINPVHIAPASAPSNEIKEFNNGELVAFGAGIHLPNPTYQFLGDAAGKGNSTVREMYIPGDAYLHYGFLFKNNNYALKVWGRGLYSDEMYNLYYLYSDNDDGYLWTDDSRTPWASHQAIGGNPWKVEQSWDTHVWLMGNYHDEPSIFAGLTNIGARMGVMVRDGHAHLINHKDVGYGGGTYQDGSKGSKTYYRGNLLINDDDITYIHEDYLMEFNTSYVMHNGPSFQFGWEFNGVKASPTKVKNHTIWSSDRLFQSFWKNHGVFDSRLRLGALNQHNGGIFENMEFWGKESVIWNLRIWDEETSGGPSVSILGDKTFKNINIRQASYNKENLCTERNQALGQESYIRFFHFDNLVIEGDKLDHIDDGNHFVYNQSCKPIPASDTSEISSGVLLHTFTFFSLPDPIAEPASGTAPIGDAILVQAENDKFVQPDASLPVSLSPAVANQDQATEGFLVTDAGDGYIALRAFNGYYLKADPMRYGYLYTVPDIARGDEDSQSISDDAKFIWVDLGNDDFALWSKSMGLYVRMETNSGPEMPLYAASDTVGANETFTVTGTTTPPVFASIVNQTVEAETFSDSFGAKLANSDAVGYIKNNTWVSFDLNLTNIATDIEANFSLVGGSVKAGAVITILADDVVIGSVTTPVFGPQELPVILTLGSISDISTLKLEFGHSTETGFLLDIDKFTLKYQTTAN
ncbi:Ig-like domain-containing protein [Catenovulum maritimum]|uniref:Fibronectin type-III domain-containing protein n=1 Tax=Catenovulum maritimum TaxID=1513271 RepID=A0A0J8GXJ8_9ALTE|nr:Ig-like domain-containing protein [Catenovulum maritimum]KMT65473.1 hypothetical protein XM47_08975 [Catenovulum maritimum]